MGATNSSALTPYQKFARSFRSFNNKSSLPAHAPSESAATAGENGPGSTSSEIQLVTPPTTDGSTTEKVESKRIELLQLRSVAIVALSIGLIFYLPASLPDHPALSVIFFLFVFLSIFVSAGSWCFMDGAKPSQGLLWLLEQAMKIATTSFVISVILRIRIALLPSNPFKWYVVVVPILIVAGIFLYLWCGWAYVNSLEQAASASPASTGAETCSEVSIGDIDLREII